MIGVFIEGRAVEQIQYLGRDSYVTYPIRWSECEPEKGHIVWPNEVDDDLIALRPWRNRLILNVKNSPLWARLYPEAECSCPVWPQDYGTFVERTNTRYHPWAISVWNEFETSAMDSLANGTDHFLGGFGLQRAWRYGQCVRRVWERVHPMGTKVIAGELNGGGGLAWDVARKNCKGMYDYVGFHAYAEWPGMKPGQQWIVNKTAKQIKSGGDKRIICTETNFIKHDGNCSPTFLEDQKEYLRILFAALPILEVEGILVYAGSSGWRGADLWRNPAAHAVYLRETGEYIVQGWTKPHG